MANDAHTTRGSAILKLVGTVGATLTLGSLNLQAAELHLARALLLTQPGTEERPGSPTPQAAGDPHNRVFVATECDTCSGSCGSGCGGNCAGACRGTCGGGCVGDCTGTSRPA